jgi:Skp family chaperone for outer membrane proteins
MDSKHVSSILKNRHCEHIPSNPHIWIARSFYMLLVMTILIFTTTTFAADSLKIAVVDIQYVLDHSVAVTNLRESIDKLSEKLHKEMSSKEAQLKNTEAELVKKRGILAQEQFDTEVNNFYKKVSEAQHDMQQKKAKLEQAHADAIGIVHDSTLKIIADLAKEKKFNIALPISQILYTDDDLSITSEVVSRLNNTVKSIPLNYK